MLPISQGCWRGKRDRNTGSALRGASNNKLRRGKNDDSGTIVKPMQEDEGITLNISRDDAKEYLQLAEASDKSLEDVHDTFRYMLEEALEHPFRDTLPETLGEMLGYLETLPEVDCDSLPSDARGVVKGWLIHSAFMLAFVTGYYDTMSAEA
jgi:hypothetical protein